MRITTEAKDVAVGDIIDADGVWARVTAVRIADDAVRIDAGVQILLVLGTELLEVNYAANAQR